MANTKKRYSQGDSKLVFGSEIGYVVGEPAQQDWAGYIHVTQYGARVVGPLRPDEARELAKLLLLAADNVGLIPGKG